MTLLNNEQFRKAGFKWYDRFKDKAFICICEGKVIGLYSHWTKHNQGFAFDISQVVSIDACNADVFSHSLMSLSFRSADGFLGTVFEDALGWDAFLKALPEHFPKFDIATFEKLKGTVEYVGRCWQSKTWKPWTTNGKNSLK